MDKVRETDLADGSGENLIRATRGLNRLNRGQGYPLSIIMEELLDLRRLKVKSDV